MDHITDPLAPWALGCLRLHEAADPEALVHAALDAGCRTLDLADVYGDGTPGHAESIAALALASWAGPGETVRIVTKGGLVRRGKGRWDTNGKAKHLMTAARGSLERLGRIDLYLLHARDPRTSFGTTLRALNKLARDGVVGAVGLCNVRVCDIEQARAITEISAVQIAMGPFDREPIDGGVARYCAQNAIELMAHSPFGGFRSHRRVAGDETLQRAADQTGGTPYEVTVSWLSSLGAMPVIGSTRPETLPAPVDLGTSREALDAFPGGALRRARPAAPHPAAEGEVVLLMGVPGAGKSTAVQEYVDRGYGRLNRDERGGRLDDLLPELDAELARGQRTWVLDNTYAARATRQRVVDVAWKHGVPTRCVWLRTSQWDAQRNAAERMLERHGTLLGPVEMRASRHPADFAPNTQAGWLRRLEEPVPEEGHAAIEHLAFVRRERQGEGRALAFDYRLVWGGKPVPGAEVAVLRGAAEQLAAWGRTHTLVPLAFLGEKDWPGESWSELLTRTHELLGLPLDPWVCRHPSGPPVCWCRKPMPGLVVHAMRSLGLGASQVSVVQTSLSDRQLAKRLGCPTVSEEQFFEGPPSS